MPRSQAIVLDDRLLIEELLVGLGSSTKRKDLWTTSTWYFRACRAAVLGAGGFLSGPFASLPDDEQRLAILSLLELRDDIGLPDARVVTPSMARIALRHERLNLLNLEAVALASELTAVVWMTASSAAGVLPEVLDSERIPWVVVDVN